MRFCGHLDLSDNPANTKFDMAWSEGGVQQVWGLGVPLWRLPFEILARAVGQPAFPDRVCLAVFIALVTYVVLCTFTVDDSVREPGDWLRGIFRNPLGIASVIILIAFPPIITLCRGVFNVYEEAVVYSFYYAIALFAASVDFAPAKNVALSGDPALAGLAGFMRPTDLAYGFAALVVTCIYARRGLGLVQVCGRAGRVRGRRSAAGVDEFRAVRAPLNLVTASTSAASI